LSRSSLRPQHLFFSSPKTNRRVEYKNEKFGFGGQKKNSKKNTADSSADVFNKKSTKWQRPAFHAQKGKKVGFYCRHFSVQPSLSSCAGQSKAISARQDRSQTTRTDKEIEGCCFVDVCFVIVSFSIH
jgi:hypothetical protein